MTRYEELLTELSEQFRDRIAVITDARQVSYGQLERLAIGCAQRLHDGGVLPGRPSIVMAPNSLAFLVSYFGTLMSGAIVTCVDPSAPKRELEGIFRTTEPASAVLPRRIGARDIAVELEGLLPGNVIWIDDLDVPTWEEESDRSVIVPRDPGSMGFLAFTSGSTGQPKGALHRTDTLLHTSKNFARSVLQNQAFTSASTFPMYNMGGICMILPVLMGGGTIVVVPGFTASALVRAIEEHGVSFAVMTPAMAELFFLKGDLENHDVSAFKRMLLCAAPISNQLCRRLADELDMSVYIAYGLTEVPGGWLTTREDTPVEDIGPFVGWPMKGYELAILDDDGNPLDEGEAGEVCIRTVYRLFAYINDPVSTAALIDADGWIHTGDVGTLRHDGGLEIRGRKKDMYIRGGFNVYPREVEEALATHAEVSLAAVHAVDDPVLGEKGFAWIVLKEGSRLSVDELRSFASERLAHYKVPDFFRITSDLPMIAAGKVDKPQLRTLAAEHMVATGVH
jgi:fatty-acyl-CoA synthase